MKAMRFNFLLCLGLVSASSLCAQVFNSGSSGALGDVVITSNTVWDIPNNGQFHVNTLVVQEGATLSFRKPTNGLNPPVYILARSNVTIEVNGAISVDGEEAAPGLAFSEGGPGGFRGGGAGIPPGSYAGAGEGPGRGLPHFGASYGTQGGGGQTYGNLLLFPLVGGSGGGGSDGNPGCSGGGGGGALLIASDAEVSLAGRVYARGGNGSPSGCGGGSGGAVRLVAPTVSGNGSIWVGGGGPQPPNQEYPGQGRARIDCLRQLISIPVIGSYGVGAPWRIGRNPVIFPPDNQRLEIVHAAGTDIPSGTNSAVQVTLGTGASSNQVVTLRAVNFSGSFQVKLDATPETGPASRTNFTWNVGTNSVATTNVTVNIPGSNPTRITAWAEVLF